MKFITPRRLRVSAGFPLLEKGRVIIMRGEYTQKGGLLARLFGDILVNRFSIVHLVILQLGRYTIRKIIRCVHWQVVAGVIG